MNDILILGGGRLGSVIKGKTGWDCLCRKESVDFDFTDPRTYRNKTCEYGKVLNCVADTRTYSEDKTSMWKVNYEAVANLVDLCNERDQKVIHVSTSYVYAGSVSNASEEDVPVHCRNWYGYTKVLADGYIELKARSYLIVRVVFKSNPFEHATAYINQIGNFGYTAEIANLIIKLIDANACGIYNVGLKIKTMYDLAKETRDVIPTVCQDERIPLDVSMNTMKMEKVIGGEM